MSITPAPPGSGGKAYASCSYPPRALLKTLALTLIPTVDQPIHGPLYHLNANIELPDDLQEV